MIAIVLFTQGLQPVHFLIQCLVHTNILCRPYRIHEIYDLTDYSKLKCLPDCHGARGALVDVLWPFGLYV